MTVGELETALAGLLRQVPAWRADLAIAVLITTMRSRGCEFHPERLAP